MYRTSIVFSYNVIIIMLCSLHIKLNFITIEMCPAPSFQPNIIVKHYDGLEVQYHCDESFVPQDVITAVCSGGRKWFPDTREHECVRVNAARSTTPEETVDAEVNQNGQLRFL